MITWSEEELNDIFSSSRFISTYKTYSKKKECIDFIRFINQIELNTKYFRLTTNNKIGRNKRFKNKNVSDDTLSLKEINSYLNKLTDKNIETITAEIRKRLVNKEYLTDMIVHSILSKCIVHSGYIVYYNHILLDIFNDKQNINELIDVNTSKIYEKIISLNIDKDQSEYLQFCDKNKHLDSLIGYSLLITELEKKKILKDKIYPSLNELLEVLNENENVDEKYKCSQCLYNIFKSFYEDSLLPQGFIDRINALIQKEKSMKIKFNLMDIIERK